MQEKGKFINIINGNIKHKFMFYGCMLFGFLVLMSFHPMADTTLNLRLSNVKRSGKVCVSVCYEAGQWPGKGKYSFVFAEVKEGDNMFSIKNIPYGQIALAIFLDTNDNGKLDTNFFGAPSEPYAFSNNVMPKFSAPSFNECSFMYLQSGQEVSIRLK